MNKLFEMNLLAYNLRKLAFFRLDIIHAFQKNLLDTTDVTKKKTKQFCVWNTNNL